MAFKQLTISGLLFNLSDEMSNKKVKVMDAAIKTNSQISKKKSDLFILSWNLSFCNTVIKRHRMTFFSNMTPTP